MLRYTYLLRPGGLAIIIYIFLPPLLAMGGGLIRVEVHIPIMPRWACKYLFQFPPPFLRWGGGLYMLRYMCLLRPDGLAIRKLSRTLIY
jgi:hypothetical protein